MIGRNLGFLVAHRGQTRGVGGVGLAATREIGAGGGFDLLEHDRLDAQVVGARVVGQVLLGGGTRLHADGSALELLGALDLALDRHHEALAVVVGDAGEVQAERGIARQRPGGVARQHVDLARLQRGEALLRVQRHELDLGAVTQHGGGNGAADVDVQTGPVALAVGCRETGQTRVDAANQLAARLDRIQVLAGVRRKGRQRTNGEQTGDGQLVSKFEHDRKSYRRFQSTKAGYGTAGTGSAIQPAPNHGAAGDCITGTLHGTCQPALSKSPPSCCAATATTGDPLRGAGRVRWIFSRPVHRRPCRSGSGSGRASARSSAHSG